jgi:hypothetical protein
VERHVVIASLDMALGIFWSRHCGPKFVNKSWREKFKDAEEKEKRDEPIGDRRC